MPLLDVTFDITLPHLMAIEIQYCHYATLSRHRWRADALKMISYQSLLYAITALV